MNFEQEPEGNFQLISDHKCPGSVLGLASKMELIENFLMDPEMPSPSLILDIFVDVYWDWQRTHGPWMLPWQGRENPDNSYYGQAQNPGNFSPV